MVLELRIRVEKGKTPRVGFMREGNVELEELSVMESCIRLVLKETRSNTASVLSEKAETSYCLPFEEGGDYGED